MIKMIFILILTCIMVSCQAQTYHQNPYETPQQLYHEYFREMIVMNPEIATQLSLDPQGEFPFDPALLTDNSEDQYYLEFAIMKQFRNWANSYKDLSCEQKIELEIFKSYLDERIESETFHHNLYAINSMFGLHIHLQSFLTEQHQIDNYEDAVNYISRLNQFEMKFRNLFIDLEYQKNHKIIPPLAIIEHTQSVLKDMISTDSKQNIFYRDFKAKISRLNLESDQEQALLTKVQAAVEKVVLSNYQEFSSKVNEIRALADNKPGAWKLPDGTNYYQYCLQRHTTTDLSADEIHQLGLQEVARIQAEMLSRFAELGFNEDQTFGEIEAKWWQSLQGKDYSFPQGETGKNQALDHYLDILADARENLPNYFERIPQTEVTVMRVPAHKEKFTGAHYKRAPMDGSRPAAFYTNLSWTPRKPGMATLLYHETIPGHHLQISYAMEFCNSPMYRNFTFFTGFIEGWALYAEKLAFEEGWHKDIHSELGYLGSELHRAVRLVVDTGIHDRKWSQAKAYNYMRDNLGWGSHGEINRYTVWPGQACAYKIGELKILELRQKAKDQLGDDFDLKEFHEVVLRNGAIPLHVLEEVVNAWLENKREKG